MTLVPWRYSITVQQDTFAREVGARFAQQNRHRADRGYGTQQADAPWTHYVGLLGEIATCEYRGLDYRNLDTPFAYRRDGDVGRVQVVTRTNRGRDLVARYGPGDYVLAYARGLNLPRLPYVDLVAFWRWEPGFDPPDAWHCRHANFPGDADTWIIPWDVYRPVDELLIATDPA